jgi:hypothetical protein
VKEPKTITLTPDQQGLVGARVGAILAGGLWHAKVVPPPGAVADVAPGPGFSAWRRSKKAGLS